MQEACAARGFAVPAVTSTRVAASRVEYYAAAAPVNHLAASTPKRGACICVLRPHPTGQARRQQLFVVHDPHLWSWGVIARASAVLISLGVACLQSGCARARLRPPPRYGRSTGRATHWPATPRHDASVGRGGGGCVVGPDKSVWLSRHVGQCCRARTVLLQPLWHFMGCNCSNVFEEESVLAGGSAASHRITLVWCAAQKAASWAFPVIVFALLEVSGGCCRRFDDQGSVWPGIRFVTGCFGLRCQCWYWLVLCIMLLAEGRERLLLPLAHRQPAIADST